MEMKSELVGQSYESLEDSYCVWQLIKILSAVLLPTHEFWPFFQKYVSFCFCNVNLFHI